MLADSAVVVGHFQPHDLVRLNALDVEIVRMKLRRKKKPCVSGCTYPGALTSIPSNDLSMCRSCMRRILSMTFMRADSGSERVITVSLETRRRARARTASIVRSGPDIDGEGDEKLICVPVKDVTQDHIKEVEDLGPEFKHQVEHFYSHYKDWKNDWKGSPVSFNGWGDAAAARQVIQDSIARAGAKS